jgi:putative ABC transport system permease protein
MPDWKHVIRTRLSEAGVTERADADLDEIVQELTEHVDELYRSALAAEGEDAAAAAVEAEMADLPALVRAARAERRRRLPPASEGPSSRLGPFAALAVFWRDVVHGARLLMARPAFTAVAVLTLALGIGANTAIFSVVYSLFLAPLPFPHADRLVNIWETELDRPDSMFIVSAPNWKDWVKENTSFESMAIWEVLSYNVSGGTEPEQVSGMRVSASTFRLFGIPPQLGRTFTDAEDEPGHRVVVISDTLWRRRFDARPDVIGKPMRLNGQTYEVIGVMPEAFRFTNGSFHVWVPIEFNINDASRDSHSFFAAGRLKPGVTFEAARADMDALGRRRQDRYEEDRGDGVTITRLQEFGVAYLQPTLQALAAAVALVLLIACVNVANLLLAQASARHREFTIRTALGASRWRVASQLLAEGLLLALAGGAVGVLIAWAGTSALAQTLPGSITRAPFRAPGVVALNAQVLAFTGGLALLTGVLFSLAPMVGVSRLDPGGALRAGGGRGGTARFSMMRTALVGIEVALALIVLCAAGLMIKSVTRLLHVDPGFDASRLLVLDVALPQPDFYGPPVRTTFCDNVQREIAALPGVVSVAAISHLPFEGNAGRGFSIEGRAQPDPNRGFSANYRLTCPGYFGTLGIPIIRGRDFSAADTTTAAGVVIINEDTAKAYWPNEDPIGHRIRLGSPSNPWLTVVGLVKSVRHFGLDNVPRREIYRPYSQSAWPVMSITVKTASEPMLLAAPVKAAVARIDPDQPVSRIRTMDRVIVESTGGRRFPMQLLGLFSLVALALSAIGVYGVVGYIVSQRTREIGIRVALGARRGQVVRLVVLKSLLPIVIGLAAGAAGALATSRLLGSLLYQVTPSDPLVLGAIVALLGTTALAASWIPARRAATVDPVDVLRQE